MKVKTSELTGHALDWAVATAEGEKAELNDGEIVTWRYVIGREWRYRLVWEPSTNWAQGGPLIEREKISIEHMTGAGDAGADVWVATRIEHPAISEEQGSTPLEAAMRCYVASQLGDEVDVPKWLEELK